MSTLPAEPVLLLGASSLVSGLLSLMSGGRKSHGESLQAKSSPAPSVTLFVPCCGNEPGLEANLEAVMRQDHPSYRVVFTVESDSDSAVPVLNRLLSQHSGKASLVVAGPAAGRSQKVHNLLVALAQSDPTDVWAFADSDGRPRADWLGQLVEGLCRPGTGVASSYRFYVPEPHGFAALLRSVWNLSVASLLGDHGRNFAWGGAMAIRREVFEQVGVAAAWRGALSDDYAMTHAVRRAGKRVTYVPEATVPSFGNVGLRELLDWTTRQIRITRVYWPRMFYLAAASHLAYAAFLVLAPFAGPPSVALLAAVLLVTCASGGRRAAAEPLASHVWAYALFAPLASLVTAQGVVRALLSRRILWRGKLYEMRSPEETVLLGETHGA